MAGPQAKKIDVIYAESEAVESLVVTLGDSIRGQDWGRKEYPDDAAMAESRGGLHAIFLAAKRAGAPHTGGDWLAWMDHVTLPDDEEESEAPAAGESDGPPSAA